MPQVVHQDWQPPYLAPGPVYLDSNVTVAHLSSGDRFHARSTQFVGEHLIGNVSLMTSLLSMDETIWVVLRGMMAQAQGVPRTQVNLGKLVKAGPHVLAPFLPSVKTAIDQIITWAPLATPSCSMREVWDAWFDRLSNVGGVHDAAHLALAEKGGAKSFVTADADFRAVKTLPYALTICYL